ncbi:hypothetical protein Ancab_026226 [Ancistrocladus abbreviatus]
MAFPRFQWLMWGGKRREEGAVFTDSSVNTSSELGFLGLRETETVKVSTFKGPKFSSSSSLQRKVKKKWQSREERRIDKEHDVVLVPSDGVCFSGSESDDSDWSIGWLEPHGSDFLTDDETDDSFAVLVPCYRNERKGMVDGPNNQLLSAIKNLTNEHFDEGKNFMDQWLSSLRNC